MSSRFTKPRLVQRYAVCILLAFCISCDTFKEDFIPFDSQLVFSQTEFYAFGRNAVMIDLHSVLSRSSVAFTLEVSKDPEKGILSPPEGHRLLYTPRPDFVEGKDFFEFTVLQDGQAVKTQSITIAMVTPRPNLLSVSRYEYVHKLKHTLDAQGNVYLAGVINNDIFLGKINFSGVQEWATYFGGTAYEEGHSIAVDTNGNIYLSGSTSSTSGIATPNSHQDQHAGGYSDAFLAKFNNQGVIQWATYYGGGSDNNTWERGYDIATSLAIDEFGNSYVAGYTNSVSDIAEGGHQNEFAGGSYDAFLAKFNADGERQWATYYGGSGSEDYVSTDIDSEGNIFLSGYSGSATGIATQGSQVRPGEFLVKFNPHGVRQWGTFYGQGNNPFDQRGMATDQQGNIYLAGTFWHSDQSDAYLTKFSSDGWQQWVRYYGGNDYEECGDISVDTEGSVFLTGRTLSATGIATPGSYQERGGGGDAFLAKFNSSGSLQWGTYYGGSYFEFGHSVNVDAIGNIYMTGSGEIPWTTSFLTMFREN